MTFRVAAYDDPESVRFVDAVQAFYVERYGGADRTPVDPAEFSPPRGIFLLGSLPGTGPVCCGGWRRHEPATIEARDRDVLRPGDAEIKRMWVDPAHRRRGLATAVLAELERTAAAAGCGRTVLESGSAQPEAIAFYRARGYHEMPGFGVYRDAPGSICFARGLAPDHDRPRCSADPI
ncbi:GNAT family N-acetyltransferase [Actinomycetospora cinnamomea]|uniref:GNAT family N-acetyltransferase n=1 Tax=Actinomycetospora cinnamomea TaxID=663609 RepID=UPI000E324229|nr:GNAT family N-acetyltransferase [Actinomycetospora cinnamomea]